MELSTSGIRSVTNQSLWVAIIWSPVSLTNLLVIFDAVLTLNPHIKQVSQMSSFCLFNICYESPLVLFLWRSVVSPSGCLPPSEVSLDCHSCLQYLVRLTIYGGLGLCSGFFEIFLRIFWDLVFGLP